MDLHDSSFSEAAHDESVSVPWTAGDVLGAIVSIVALGGICFLLLVAFVAFMPGLAATSKIGVVLVGTIFVEGLLFLVAWSFTVSKYRCSWGTLGFRPFWPFGSFLLIWVVVLGGLVANILYASLLPLLGLDFLRPAPFPQVFRGPGPASMVVIGLAILVAPVAEEVFFRGFVFTGLGQRYGARWGAIGSSALFSLGHFQLGYLLPIFFLGLLLSWLYVKSGSIWPCIVAHLVYNAAGLVVPFALGTL